MLRERIGSLSVLVFALGVAACDSFMIVEGRVTDCATGAPIVGVRATLTLGEGVSASERAVAFSEPDGKFDVSLNEPDTASATLLLEKPGYTSLTRAFSEAPEDPIAVCLTRP